MFSPKKKAKDPVMEAQLVVERVQADSMLPRAACPVMLLGEAASAEAAEPWLRFNLARRRVEKRVRRVVLSAQQLSIAADEPTLVALHAFHYSDDHLLLDVAMFFVIGAALRVAALAALVALHRERRDRASLPKAACVAAVVAPLARLTEALCGT